mmetsp:Transcript_1107/g.1689  ORF Transcript_1107/g.1689 Transcript_1107/m.1689 type:complete len:352 (+) Transcript_1107:61-1116(+)|eukprot:CAMPEP_0171452574 /NCGR_PEP_ID=MMETSP0945-20130129/626_1 /TAXON_ID=109269 /ORGANISM="Vaucheria litorea, Strain CCMP2940" /LENGTH=351 /DNA_ID=CAMNT_0011977265 /DNA_START=55 /DNA_END=1110 /DNA_ORIENTATION=-
MSLTPDTIRVVITGGAGQIAYSLIPLISKGLVFGPTTSIDLRLLDIEPAMNALKGVVMEIQDGSYDLIDRVTAHTDENMAFKDADVGILLGGYPRKQGMERYDLIEKNVRIMRLHGRAIENHASRDCKVLVVANPANTNCLVAMKYAPSIPTSNFTALTRLDHDRLKGMLAAKIKTSPQNTFKFTVKNIRNHIIWGNHSGSQVPDTSHAEVNVDGTWMPVRPLCHDDAWLDNGLISKVQQRGSEIIAARKLSSAMSAANAIANHIIDWFAYVPPEKGMLSMSVLSDGNTYGIPNGLVFSFPVRCGKKSYSIVPDLSIDSKVRAMLDRTVEELLEEKKLAESIIGVQQESCL